MSNEALYVSINPIAAKKIEQGVKTYEFRNYRPKNSFKFLYVYVTSPISELKYILEIGNITEYPHKIIENGDGNIEFNNGAKTKFAYKIAKVYKLANSIKLKILKEKFTFVPPQAYAYDKKYCELSNYLDQVDKELILGSNTTNHKMKLQPESFSYIKHGTKRIEIRLFDQKRQQIKLEDTITFFKELNCKDILKVKVIGLLRYSNFDDMIRDFDISILTDKLMTKEKLKNTLNEYYSKEKQIKYEVIGIRIKLI